MRRMSGLEPQGSGEFNTEVTGNSEVKEILEELLAGDGEDGFGVELDPFDFVAAMAEAHDDAVAGLGGDG